MNEAANDSADPGAGWMPRSPDLMNREDSALLVIDVQQRLLPVIPENSRLVWNIGRLLRGAEALGVRIAGTEQYPEKLGPTVPELAQHLNAPPSKAAFSCAECRELFAAWRDDNRHRILVCGIETHVCVQQTVLDLLGAGFAVYVAVDAVGSRFKADRDVALRRMETSGATLTTVEAALFEWCEVAGTPEFKTISRLAKESPPA